MSQGCRAEGVSEGSLPHILPSVPTRGPRILKGHCRQKGVRGRGCPCPCPLTSAAWERVPAA